MKKITDTFIPKIDQKYSVAIFHLFNRIEEGNLAAGLIHMDDELSKLWKDSKDSYNTTEKVSVAATKLSNIINLNMSSVEIKLLSSANSDIIDSFINLKK